MQSRISYLGKGAKKARPYRRGQLQRRSTCTVHGSLILVNMVQAEEVLGMLAGGNRRQ